MGEFDGKLCRAASAFSDQLTGNFHISWDRFPNQEAAAGFYFEKNNFGAAGKVPTYISLLSNQKLAAFENSMTNILACPS